MKSAITFLAILISFVSQSQIIYDTSRIAAIPLDTSASYSWHLKGNVPITLTPGEIYWVDKIVNTCISENNNNGQPTTTFGRYIGIHIFKKQLVGSIDENGDIVVWVNCFSETITAGTENWRRELFIVHDGGVGGGFFNVMVNVTAKKYYSLYVNGM